MSFFRLYSPVSSFWTRSNIKLLMKVLQMWTRRQTLVLWSHLAIPAACIFANCSGCHRCFSFITLTASSRSDSSPSHSLSNQNVINLSSSCPRLDYTPFIRCSITLTSTLLCHSSLNSESHLCLEDKLQSFWLPVVLCAVPLPNVCQNCPIDFVNVTQVWNSGHTVAGFIFSWRMKT